MWISFSVCCCIARTTSGWQWPVEQTATPALQSRKMLPSTSSTHTPLARSATSLKDGRGYDGLTNLASASTIFWPFGPGREVLISGRLGGALTLVDMCLTPCVCSAHCRAQRQRLKPETLTFSDA